MNAIFTESAQGRFSVVVAVSICGSFCEFVTLQLIVNYAQTVRFVVFCQKIYCLIIFLYIQNLKGHQNCIICSKVFSFLIFYCVILSFTKGGSYIDKLKKKIIREK